MDKRMIYYIITMNIVYVHILFYGITGLLCRQTNLAGLLSVINVPVFCSLNSVMFCPETSLNSFTNTAVICPSSLLEIKILYTILLRRQYHPGRMFSITC